MSRRRTRRGDPVPAASPSARGRISTWRGQHAWSLHASVQRLAAHPIGTALTLTVMGFALALPLAFYLALGNLQRFGAALGESQAISVFLKPGLGAAAVAGLASDLRARADVAVVVTRTPQQGLAELSAMQGFGPGLAALTDNPLPYVLVVTPRAGPDAHAGQALVAALRALPAADRVQDNSAWRGRLDALLTLGRRVLLLLGALLALAALLVVGNSVRQDIQAHAEEIAVLQLVGASPGFVRRPYLYAGICYGFGSGVVAVALVLLLELALRGPVATLAAAWGGSLRFAGLAPALLLAVPFAAAVLGWLGARIAGARHLTAAEPY